jgi:DNA recombination protein RmuC
VEIVIIILLVILTSFFLWDRFRREQRLKEHGDTLTKSVGERIDGTIRIFGELKETLGELAQRTKDIEEAGKNISSLQEILQAPKPRGCLGELMLERLLADILPHKNYRLQYRFQNGENVDAVIRIGENLVPIDSKFPLEGFKRILSAGSEDEQIAFRRQFNRTIKKHIDNVARYILPDENTFDFALMYIPAENVYYETILRDQTEESEVYSYSLQKRVIPVSPNSFYAYLQVILLGLKGLHIESAAHEILGHLGRLHSDLTDFQEDYATLGMHIGHAGRKYDEAARKLTRLSDKLQITSETPVEGLEEGNSEIPDKSVSNE